MSEFIDTIKVGDEIAVQFSSNLAKGLSNYHVPYYRYYKVDKITPKRTKYVVGGVDYTSTEASQRFFPISEQTDKENEIHEARSSIDKLINNLLMHKSSYGYENILHVQRFKDEDLERGLECLKVLNDILIK